jgi:GT2 family glycosyltransferase
MDLYFVSCTRGAKEPTLLHCTLVKHGITSFRFFEHNTRGLPACYNEVLAERAGRNEVIVFAHDDILIGDISLREKITGEIEDGAAIVGVAGSSVFIVSPPDRITLWRHPDKRHNSGSCEFIYPGNDGIAHYVPNPYGETPRRCVVLDGMLMAVAANRIGDIRFDERFEFHFYDLDFCLSAHRAGLKLITTNLYTSHASKGDFGGPTFQKTQAIFREKWAGFDRIEC